MTPNTLNGAAGGSGVVIVRYLGASAGSGGTVSTGTGSATGYTLHTFKSTGNNTLALNAINPVFKGVISGTGSLSVDATNGTLSLTGTNTYTGNTSITGGTVVVGGSGSLGSGNYTGAISNAGTFKYSSSVDQILGGILSGAGTLTKDTATSKLILTGNNIYSGTIIISAGTLQAGDGGTTGSLGSGAVSNSAALVFNRSNNLTHSLLLLGGNVTLDNIANNDVGNLAASGVTLTVSGTTVAHKVYDGTTTAALSGGTLVGVVGSDNVILNHAGNFADKNAGTGKTLLAADSITGTDASNYTLTQPTGLSANITPSTNTAGMYTGVLQASGLTASNYNIGYVAGDYSIVGSSQLLVRVNNQSSIYGAVASYSLQSVEYFDGNQIIRLDNSSVAGSSVAINGSNQVVVNDGASGTANFTLAPVAGVMSGANKLTVGSYPMALFRCRWS